MEKTSSFWDTKTIVLTVLCFLLVLTVIIINFNGSQNKRYSIDIEKSKEFAATLLDQKLFVQAIDEYKKISAMANDKEQANIYYIIANIYMENLKDYENALTFFYKSKLWGVEKNIEEEINRRIVSSLEHMGRSIDAEEEMQKITTLDEKDIKKTDGSAVIAKIGQREITVNELSKAIDELPINMRSIYKNDKTKKMEFLNQYIARILILNTAKRKSLDKDSKINEQLFQIKKDLMIERLLNDEIDKNIAVSLPELKLYYETHKDEFKEKSDEKKKGKDKEKFKTFDEVKNSIENIVHSQKQQEAYKKMLMRMQEAEEVKVFNDRSF